MWRSIEDAPQDGTTIMLKHTGGVSFAQWRDGWWRIVLSAGSDDLAYEPAGVPGQYSLAFVSNIGLTWRPWQGND